MFFILSLRDAPQVLRRSWKHAGFCSGTAVGYKGSTSSYCPKEQVRIRRSFFDHGDVATALVVGAIQCVFDSCRFCPNSAACFAEKGRDGSTFIRYTVPKLSSLKDPVELWMYKEQANLLAVTCCSLKDQT